MFQDFRLNFPRKQYYFDETPFMSTESEQPKQNSGMLRKVILFGVLGLGLLALWYDRSVARPAVDAAYDSVTELHEETLGAADVRLSDADIQKVLGREPDSTFEHVGHHVEVYSWAAGFPFKKHNLYVVYRVSDAGNVFFRHSKFVHDKPKDVGDVTSNVVLDLPEDASVVNDDMGDDAYGALAQPDEGATGPSEEDPGDSEATSETQQSGEAKRPAMESEERETAEEPETDQQ